MTDRKRRLQRLVNAQGEMVRSLEAVLVHKKSRAVALQDAMAEIDRLATVACASNPASLPAILRSLTARDMELKQVLEEIGGLRQRLLSARAGEKMATSAFKRVRVLFFSEN